MRSEPVLALYVYIRLSFYSLSGGGKPDMGEGERAGRSPDLVNKE